MLQLDDIALQIGGFHLSAQFSLPQGARAAVIGPSGAGKSSLLLLIAGFLRPVSGRVLWQGQDITTRPAEERPVSMLFQDQNLFAHLTLGQNVALGLTAGRRITGTDMAKAEAALTRVGLQGMANRLPHQVSGGQMARAALARVLLQARPLLLLDEPFAALDSALRADMLDLVSEVASETQASVLMVSHDTRDAQRFANQVINVTNGRAHAAVSATAYFAHDKGPAL